MIYRLTLCDSPPSRRTAAGRWLGLLLALATLPAWPDIQPAGCAGADFVKPVAIATAGVADGEGVPDIMNLQQAFSRRLGYHLGTTGRYHPELVPAVHGGPVAASDLWRRDDIPFLVVPRLEQLNPTSSQTHFDFMPHRSEKRSVGLHLDIFDGTGPHALEPVSITRQSNMVGYYPQRVDALESSFWESDYGQIMDLVARHGAQEIDRQLRCLPLIGRVLRVNGQHLTVGLGSRHGLQIGSGLLLVRHGAGIPLLGRGYEAAHIEHSLGYASVVNLGPQTATLLYTGAHRIEVGDRVRAGQ